MRRLLHAVGLFLLMGIGRLPGRRLIGGGVGRLMLLLLNRRRRIAETNLRLALPDASEIDRRRLLRRHFKFLGEWVMDILWALTAKKSALARLVRLEGEIPSSPCILLVPHFLGLDIALLRLNADLSPPLAYYYKPLHNAFWDMLIHRLRGRFGSIGLRSTSRYSLLRALRHLRDGGVFVYLPDIDPRNKKSTVFVPFMGQERVATTSGLARLAQATKRPVVPFIVCRRDNHYIARLLPPLTDFPGEESSEDSARRMNALIGEWVEKAPENYFWLHRRFKTTTDAVSVYD